MKRLIILILVLSSLFSIFISLNSLGYIEPYYVVNLPPDYYECIYQNVSNGLFTVYYSTAPIYFVIQSLGGYTLFSTQGSSYYGYISLPAGEYKILFVNNVSNSNVTIQAYLGAGRPSPTGIADYGIEAINGIVHPYIEKFNEVVGVAQIYSISAYNASIDSYGASLQLNTVLQVNTIYGSQEYWLQNVIQFMTNTSEYRFVDNVWNLTSSPSVLNANSIIGSGSIYLTFEGTHLNNYYGYASQYFNLTYPLYTALLIKAINLPQGIEVLFGYLNRTSFTIYDNVTIKVTGITSAYLLVDGYNTTGSGNAYDTEFVFGGQQGGEITSFNRINALIYMFYINNNSIFTPKSLFPFGLDTAEASDNLFTIPYQGAYKVEIGNDNEVVITNTSFPLKAKIVNGSSVIDLGQTSEVELNVTGGTPPYIVEIGNKTYVDLFLGNTYYSITPNRTGNITYAITVEDLYGETRSLNYSLKVNPDPTISIIISRNNTDVGIPIFLNANVQGGTPPYTESWYINGTPVSNDGVLNYTFSSSGVYNVSLKITDSVNFTVEKSVMVEVHKDPTLIVSTNKTETDQGIPIELNVTGNYGISPYLVKVYINGTIINTSIINTGVKLPLNLPSGVYLVRVTLTDSVGYQVSKGIILKFNKDPILAVSNVTQGNFFVTITSMTLSGEGSEGTSPYTYTVYVNGNEYYTGSDLSLNVPLNLGENNITVVMKDSLGITVTRTILVYSSYNWINILIVVALIVIIPVISVIFSKKRRN